MIKKIFYTILLILLLLVIGLTAYLFWQKPNYKGTVTMTSLSEDTSCYFDEYGVPHIYANNEIDAIKVLGYLHAKERLWQMELMRRIAPGKLSEILGADTLEIDEFFAHLGIEEHNKRLAEQLLQDPTILELANAYVEGVNHYIYSEKSPIEFHVLNVKKTQFSVLDIFNIYGYMAFSFAHAHKTDPLVTHVHQKYGATYLEDFGLDGSLFTTQIGEDTKDYVAFSNQISELINNTPVPSFIGSNSWVLGTSKTKNNQVILANDPHIMFSQPGTWYEAHIKTNDYEIYGYYVPGTPFPLLGHNQHYAYGLTMLQNDDADLFQIKLKDKQYQLGNSTATIFEQSKTINIKGQSPKTIIRQVTALGPIVSNINKYIESKEPIALRWTYLEKDHQMLRAIYELSHTKSIEDYQNAVSKIAAPGLNVMYGDSQGNIAWIGAAHLYQVDDSINTYQILKADNPNHLKRKELTFESNPKSINPTSGYVYSANNQPKAVDGYLYPGYYLPKYRADRIIELIEAKNDWTKEEVSQMMFDVQSNNDRDLAHYVAQKLLPLSSNETEQKLLKKLQEWDGNNQIDLIAPLVYNHFIFFYLKHTFEDELGATTFETLLETHLMKQMIGYQIKNTNSPWWDDVYTKNITETQEDILQKAFQSAMASLSSQLGKDINTWTWQKAHQLELEHPFGKNKWLRPYFSINSGGVDGTNEVINNLMFTYSEVLPYKIKAGPSTRRVIDFSDVSQSWSILPSGQSGHVMSPHYKNQASMFANGTYRSMYLDEKEIRKNKTLIIFKSK